MSVGAVIAIILIGTIGVAGLTFGAFKVYQKFFENKEFENVLKKQTNMENEIDNEEFVKPDTQKIKIEPKNPFVQTGMQETPDNQNVI